VQLTGHSWHWLQNFDQSFDGAFPQGNKTINLDWTASALPSLTNQPVNTAISVNVRSALTGDATAVANASIAVIYVSGDPIANWTAPGSGNNLTDPATQANSGVFLLRATYLGLTVDSPPIAWSIVVPVTGRKKKWTAGHWAGAFTTLGFGDPISNLYPDTDRINNLDLVNGYRCQINWGVLQQHQGVYIWTQLDALINRLQTAYNKPKKLILVVLPGSFGAAHPGSNTDYYVLPQYIMQGSQFGPAGYATWNFNVSPATVTITNAGTFGWWGGNGNGNTYAACLHRPAVMAEWIALHQAIAQRYDSNVALDSVWFQENSWWIGSSSANRNPDWSATATNTQTHSLIAAAVAAFNQTNIQFENTWAGDATLTQQLEADFIKQGVLPGSADTTGAAKIASNGSLGSWGMDAYQGKTAGGSTYTGPDYRPVIPSAMDIEAPDLGAYGFGTRFTTGPADALAALNKDYAAAYAAWCVMYGTGTGAPTNALWDGPTGLGQFLNNPANALVNTAYPTAAGY